MTILAIDAGTTGVTVLLVDHSAHVISHGYREFAQHFPENGWVEHDPGEIWQATLAAARDCLSAAPGHSPIAIGITNQRETAVLWDRETLGSARRAIVWQDRRTAEICDRLIADGHEPAVRAQTGLRLDPYFTATKLTWIAENEPNIWSQVVAGRTAIGTVDSYLIARLTRGLHHVTDASNASRTLLYDLHTGAWSMQLCELFGVPIDALPEIVPSYGVIGNSDPTAFLGLELPIAGIAGDQQAALFGQACFSPGEAKCSYGTGSFILLNTGGTAVESTNGLLTTVAWQHPDGRRDFALEGSVFVTGSAVQWLRDGLRIIDSAAQIEELALSVDSSDGVVFVPALTGLGAPDWDPNARGAIFGLTRASTDAHIARATLEAIAFSVRDVVDLMSSEANTPLPRLAVDGGAAANNLLCQLQATQLQIPVDRSAELESTGLGAAFLAGLGVGFWPDTQALSAAWRSSGEFTPNPRDPQDHDRWRTAVSRTLGWMETS